MRTTIAASFFRISIPFQTLDQPLQLYALDIVYCFMTQLKLISALQGDLTAISNWPNSWQLKLNIAKCETLVTSNKWNLANFTYCINGQLIYWNNLLWWRSKHCIHVISIATKSLNCSHYSLFGCIGEGQVWRHSPHAAFNILMNHNSSNCYLLYM